MGRGKAGKPYIHSVQMCQLTKETHTPNNQPTDPRNKSLLPREYSDLPLRCWLVLIIAFLSNHFDDVVPLALGMTCRGRFAAR